MRFVEGEGAHLEDLIAGVTPTYVDWDTNPTDGDNITDGDISTFCTTGNKAAAAWAYATFEWDIGALYNVICTGVGGMGLDAGNPRIYVRFWNGAAWIQSATYVSNTAGVVHYTPYGGMASKIRLGITSTSIATITPNIREFHVWKL